MTRTDNDMSLAAAYRRTNYMVDHDGGSFAIRVGEASEEVDALLQQRAQTSWAYITACNPRSERLALEENQWRQTDLRNYLREMGYCIFAGRGVAQEPGWPPEESFLVIGISREAATMLATMLEQNAVVVGTQGAPAELVFCLSPENSETD
ncbi:MAG: DUF3293 domain-containing protein [Burkholderiales bacterium]|nr:DUF3293 domain-containing protein [Burkholderiales bacterium]